MRKARSYTALPKRIYRPEWTNCLTCGSRLRRYATLTERTVVTLAGPLHVIHCGYRCPNADCRTRERSYRSAAADALALPGFTYGVDVVVEVGHLRLARHQTVDEVHQAIGERLAPFGAQPCRREVLYLFDTYCTLLQVSQQVAGDTLWQERVRANGGLIVSLDGIQPDKGNETVYLVREVLTGRLMAAEKVRSSDTPTMKQVLAPVVALNLPVLGIISDGQESIGQAVAALWPEVPHQVCQFHYLREASRPMYEADRALKVQMRKTLQRKVRAVHEQLEQAQRQDEPTNSQEMAQLAVLADYALGVHTALNLDGQPPFTYASLAIEEALTEVAHSLAELEKKGGHAPGAAPGNWNA